MEVSEVEKELLCLVPKGTEGDRQSGPAFGQSMMEILQIATVKERLHAHVRDHIEGIGGSPGHHLRQLRGAVDSAFLGAAGLMDGLSCLESPVLQADHGPPASFEYRPDRDRTFVGRSFLRGVEVQTESIRQVGGLLQLLEREALHFGDQLGERQRCRFFSRA